MTWPRRSTDFAISLANWARKRGPAGNFGPDEDLYRAVDPQHVDTSGPAPSVRITAIRFPTLSVNRSQHSRPQSVLVGRYRHSLVWALAVRDLPPADLNHIRSGLRSGQTDTYTYDVAHDPIFPWNYAHSEIRTFKNGHQHHRTDKPKQIGLDYRKHIREHLRQCAIGRFGFL